MRQFHKINKIRMAARRNRNRRLSTKTSQFMPKTGPRVPKCKMRPYLEINPPRKRTILLSQSDAFRRA